MECPTCQNDIPIGQQFCSFCGSKVEIDFDTIRASIEVDHSARRGQQVAAGFRVAIAAFFLANVVVWLWNDIYSTDFFVDVVDIPAASVPSGQLTPLPPVQIDTFEHVVSLPLPRLSRFAEQRLGFRRPGPIRDALMEQRGVTTEARQAIRKGLTYIKSKLQRAGRGRIGRVSAAATLAQKAVWADTALTGLAALAFLADGHVWVPDANGTKSEFGESTRQTIRWLVYNQRSDGQFGPDDSPKIMQQHGIAALAVVEAYTMSGDADLEEPAQQGLDFIARAQHADGGWYYRPDPKEPTGEVSLMGWQVMALVQGQRAHLRVDPNVLKKAAAYFDKMTRKGLTYDIEVPRRMGQGLVNPRGTTAVALMSRLAMGQALGQPNNRRAARLLVEGDNLPYWPVRWKTRRRTRGQLDMYFLYHATTALALAGGKEWKTWYPKLTEVLTPRLIKLTGDRGGYWDNIGRWGQFGGRVYSTAMAVLSLEAPYRYID